MILREETIKRFGYDPDILKPQSNRLIVVQCPNCLEVSEYRRQNYHEGRLCRSCNGSKVGKIAVAKNPENTQMESK